MAQKTKPGILKLHKRSSGGGTWGVAPVPDSSGANAGAGGYYSPRQYGEQTELYSRKAETARAAMEERSKALRESQKALEESRAEVERKKKRYYDLSGQLSGDGAAELLAGIEQEWTDSVTAYGQHKAAYDTAWAAYSPYEDAYNKAAAEYNNYLRQEQQAYGAWKATIRTAEDIREEQKGLKGKRAELQRRMQWANDIAAGTAAPGIQAQAAQNEAAIRELQEYLGAVGDREKLLAEEMEYSEYFRYEDLRQNGDFGRESAYQAGRFADKDKDYLYNWVNEHGGQPRDYKVTDNVDWHLERTRYMTEDEIRMYNYIHATQGADASAEYLRYLDPALNERATGEAVEKAGAWAGAHPFLGSAASVVLSPFSGVAAMAGQVTTALGGEEIDANAGYNALTNVKNALREGAGATVEENWGPVGSFAYQTGMSMADMLADAAVGGPAAMALIGSRAFSEEVIDAKKRGLSNAEAMTLGTTSMLAEVLTERLGLDEMLHLPDEWANAGFWKGLLRGVGGEAAEEGLTNLANLAADISIAGDKSEFAQSVEGYKAEDMTDQQAVLAALGDAGISLGLDMLGGGISGGVFGGISGWRGKRAAALSQQNKNDAADPAAPEKPTGELMGVADNGTTPADNGTTATNNGTEPVAGDTAQVGSEIVQKRADAPGVTQTMNENGGNANGEGEHVLPGGPERNDAPGAREQAEQYEVRRERQREEARSQTAAAAQRRVKAENLERLGKAQRVSSQDLGLKRGTEVKELLELPRYEWDNELWDTVTRIEKETGYKVRTVVGNIGVRLKNGGMGLAKGYIDRVSGSIVLNAAHSQVTAGQIGDHELWHWKMDGIERISGGRAALSRVIERRIREEFGGEELDAVLDKYIDGYGDVYDMDAPDFLERVYEEIMADAYAGINAFGAEADRFRSVVDAVMEESGMGRDVWNASEQEDYAAPGGDQRVYTDEDAPPPRDEDFSQVPQEEYDWDGWDDSMTDFSMEEGKTLDAIEKKWAGQTKWLFLHENTDTVFLDNMVVREELRDQGIGTKILEDVIAYADAAGKTVALTPTSEYGTKKRLTAWYKKHGFVENKGRNADFRLRDTMYRLPRVAGGDVRFSMDSEGRELSAEQRKFFKDSKVRDEQGRLMVMYHGTPNGSHNKFRSGTYFTPNREYADKYQNPNASMLSTKKNADAPKTYEVYLNITKPFDTRNPRERKIFMEEYYRQWGTGAPLADSGLPDWTDGMDLQEFIEEMEYDYDGLILDEGATGGYGMEVKSRGLSYVTFSPEQVKNVDNAEPTDDADIRFSMESAVEETKDLVAVHNLTPQKLLKTLELGGLPMPSIAIARAKEGFNDFGDISLVFHKDTIDPEMYRSNKVYSGDAWTPTYPKVDYKVSAKVQDRVRKKLDGLVHADIRRKLGRAALDTDNLTNTLDNHGGDAVEAFKDDDGLKYAFLRERGDSPVLPMVEQKVDKYGGTSNEAIRYFAGKLIHGTQALDHYQNMGAQEMMQQQELLEAVADTYNKEVLWTMEEGSEQYRKYEKDPDFTPDNLTFSEVNSLLTNARKYLVNGAKQTVDADASRKLIREKTDQKAFEAWLRELFDGIVEKEGIRNNQDYFTRSGNRRSFEALHYENNLENVIRVMKEKGEKGVATFGGGNIFGAATREYGSVSDIKAAAQERLRTIPESEFEEIKEGFSDRFFELANSLPINKSFSAVDDAANMLTEAVVKYKTKSGMAGYLRRESKGWANYSDYVVDDLIQLVSEIRQMPVSYFEAKPQRAVGFDEVAAAVMPTAESMDDPALVRVKERLEELGVPVKEYTYGDGEDRLKKLNEVEGVQFSMEDGTGEQELVERMAARMDQTVMDLNAQAVAVHNAKLDAEKREAEAKAERKRQSEQRQMERNRERAQQHKEERQRLRREANAVMTDDLQQFGKPQWAKRDTTKRIMDLFDTPAGMKNETKALIEEYLDHILEKGSLEDGDRRNLMDKLIERGVVEIEPDEIMSEGRSYLKGNKIYVSEEMVRELGDDWAVLRKKAFGLGVYLTNDRQYAGLDVWNADMASYLPGFFNENETDPRTQLERLLWIAEEGKTEKLSLAEYTQRLAKQEQVSEAELLDGLAEKLEQELRQFAHDAEVEMKLRGYTRKNIGERMHRQLTRERLHRAADKAHYRETMQAARNRRELNKLQERTLKTLQWLNKNKYRASEEIQAQIQEVLSDIDLYAVGAANELNWHPKYEMTWRDLAEVYKASKDSPNFIPSAELDRIVARLDNRKIEELDVNALNDLFNAAVGLRKEIFDAEKALSFATDQEFDKIYQAMTTEMHLAKKPKKGSVQDKFFNIQQLTPMNVLRQMGGWRPDGTFAKMAGVLEQGEKDVRAYKVKANRILADWLEAHRDWVHKADGQGKDGIWIEVDVPRLEGIGLEGGATFGETVKVKMTPMQRVHLYLESRNEDNLRHMVGGRTFADPELYSQGKRTEAYAQGITVKMAPETVKALVANMTQEELELARLLDSYYNGLAHDEINRVSNKLYGYNKAMGKRYAPIFTNQNFTKSEAGIFDQTAEGVGNLKERVKAKNPSYNISALDAFERNVDKTAEFVGMAIPVRDWNSLMNWRTRDSSMKDQITHEWGQDRLDYIDKLLVDLQGGAPTESDVMQELGDTLLSNYISSIFGFNPSIILKQAGSLPLAAAYLGAENMSFDMFRKERRSREFIAKYTQELQWRSMGYDMPETKQLKDKPGWAQKSGKKWVEGLFGGGYITKMDEATASVLWAWAENKVRAEHPGLEVGDQKTIDEGRSPFYQKVAEEFDRAVSHSQSVSDVAHQSTMRRSKGVLARTFTMFRSDSAQTYNALRQMWGEKEYWDGQAKRYSDAKTDGGKEKLKEAQSQQQKAAKRIGTVVVATACNALLAELVDFAMAAIKGKLKNYEDEEEERLTALSVLGEMFGGILESGAGVVVFGDEAAALLGRLITGEKGYGEEAPGLEQLLDLVDRFETAVAGVKKGDILGAVREVGMAFSTYYAGFPAENMEKFLISGLGKHLAPGLVAGYEDMLEAPQKSDLKGMKGAALETRLGHVMKEYGMDLDGKARAALAKIYEAGYTDAVPSAAPAKVTIDGRERKLGKQAQRQYDKIRSQVVNGELAAVLASPFFQEADRKTQAKMLKRLYDFAGEKAKEEVLEDYESDSTALAEYTEIAQAGGSIADCIIFQTETADMKSYMKADLLREWDAGDKTKRLMFHHLISGSYEEELEKLGKAGLGVDQFLELYAMHGQIDGRDDISATDKATEFAYWLDGQRYTQAQKAAVRSELAFFQFMPAEAARYNTATEAGLDRDDALELTVKLNELEPPEGKTSVQQIQKWRVGIDNAWGPENQLQQLKAVGMDEKTYAKCEALWGAGVAPAAYVRAQEIKDQFDTDGNGSLTNDDWKRLVNSLVPSGIALPGDNERFNMTNEQMGFLWQMLTGSKSAKNNPFSTAGGEKWLVIKNADK